MKMHETVGRVLVTMLGCGGTLAVAGEAHAIQYGELRISSNTTLSDDRYGNVVFDASNITLDCANHQVHMSSFAKSTTAIYADSKTGIRIKNCNIVGKFDNGIVITRSTSPTVTDVISYTSVYFNFNTGATGTGMTLRGFASLYPGNDTGGSFSTNITGGQWHGIVILSSLGTRIFNTTVSNSQGNGIYARASDDLTFDTVNVQNCDIGFGGGPVANAVISNSVFSNNTTYGIFNLGDNDSFLNNSAHGNGTFDAYEDPTSAHSTWSGNDFGTIGGTVPAAH